MNTNFALKYASLQDVCCIFDTWVGVVLLCCYSGGKPASVKAACDKKAVMLVPQKLRVPYEYRYIAVGHNLYGYE